MSHTSAEIRALIDAAAQCLDDMGIDGQSVCLAAKAQLRMAIEPFDDPNEPLDIEYPLTEALRVLRECDN